MHPLQQKILSLIEKEDLSGKSLREIGERVGDDSAQKIKHHLAQLAKKGFITYNSRDRIVKKAGAPSGDGLFVSLPIMGAANCGPATLFADGYVEGHLRVSKRMVPQRSSLYVLRAEGDSMNEADIRGKNIEDGDFVLVDAAQTTPESGNYVVALVDGMGNIKKYVRDPKGKRVILFSESTAEHLPIFIHRDDTEDLHIAGTVIDVIKNPYRE